MTLNLCFGLQLHLAVLHLDRILNLFAFVLLPDLAGFLLYERSKAVDIAGDRFARFLLGFREHLVELLYLIVLGASIRPFHREWLIFGCLVPYSVYFVFWLMLLRTNPLHRKQCILGTTVAFLANAA